MVLKPVLLNSWDSVTLKLHLRDFNESIDIRGRIVGIKAIDRLTVSRSRYSFIWFIMTISYLGALFGRGIAPDFLDMSLLVGAFGLYVLSFGVFLWGKHKDKQKRRIFGSSHVKG